MEPERIIEAIAARLRMVLKRDDFDVAIGEGGEAEVFTDHWTIHLGPDGGFLAVDDEPESPKDYPTAWEKALGPKAIQAIVAAEAELDGALTAAMTAGGDPFTLAFVGALRAADAPASAEES